MKLSPSRASPEASEEEILAACHIARVDEFAESFEKKYDTLVGERGVKLSGGQKQRVSIARAILADPRILILDWKPHSSLWDSGIREALIQERSSLLYARAHDLFVIAASPLNDSPSRANPRGRGWPFSIIEPATTIRRSWDAASRAATYDLYTKQHEVESNLFLAPGVRLYRIRKTPMHRRAHATVWTQLAQPCQTRFALIRGQNLSWERSDGFFAVTSVELP